MTVHNAAAPVSLRVLIVDDELLIRRVLGRHLSRRGHHVVEAADAAQALYVVRGAASSFHVVVLDYKLPDRQDLSVLREIRAVSPHSAVVMMTAHGDARMHQEAVSMGARAVLDKPFDLAATTDIIEAAGLRPNPGA